MNSRRLGKSLAHLLACAAKSSPANPMLVSKAQFERFKRAGIPEENMIIRQEMPRE